MPNVDLYAVLGVLPDAEDVVITAAYRALAQRYHPDKWKGDPEEAHRRMSELNSAYAVLADRTRRSEYERTRKRADQAEFSGENDEYQSEAFDSALNEVEDRWNVACGIFPDLKSLRARLTTISSSLAFAFVTGLLDAKAFARRLEFAAHLEQVFLERYFGTNEVVVDYARTLIFFGQKEPAKALNRLVEVMGSDIDPSLLISRIESDFQTVSFLRKKKAAQDDAATAVLKFGYYNRALELLKLHGYALKEVIGLMGKPSDLVLTRPPNERYQFSKRQDLLEWVKKTLCV